MIRQCIQQRLFIYLFICLFIYLLQATLLISSHPDQEDKMTLPGLCHHTSVKRVAVSSFGTT